MIGIKKYVPCKIIYLLKLYALMLLLVGILVFIKSCPNSPLMEMIGKAMLGPTIMFIIISPVFGLIFTKKSLNSCKFHLPYEYIKNIQIDEHENRLIITYNYNTCLGKISKKDYTYVIHADNYQTNLSEIINSFPKDIKRVNI